jgi:hypothetical protein
MLQIQILGGSFPYVLHRLVHHDVMFLNEPKKSQIAILGIPWRMIDKQHKKLLNYYIET